MENLQQNPPEDAHQGKHNKPLFFIALFICLTIIIFVGWYGYDEEKQAANLEKEAELINQIPIPLNKSISTSTTTIDISNWKTYQNNQYGFEFKYPKDWNISSNQKDFIRLDSPEIYSARLKDSSQFQATDFSITFRKNPKKLVVQKYYDGSNGLLLFDNPDKDTTIKIGGIIAYKNFPIKTLVGGIITVIPRDDYFIEIGYSNNISDQILSTFKFISTSTTETATKSGIKGTITIGPTCPVERLPPDPECADRGFEANINVSSKVGKLVKSFSSNTGGTFIVELDPGTYVLSNAGKAVMPTFAPMEVVVVSSKYTEIGLQFDSGIR